MNVGVNVLSSRLQSTSALPQLGDRFRQLRASSRAGDGERGGCAVEVGRLECRVVDRRRSRVSSQVQVSGVGCRVAAVAVAGADGTRLAGGGRGR